MRHCIYNYFSIMYHFFLFEISMLELSQGNDQVASFIRVYRKMLIFVKIV